MPKNINIQFPEAKQGRSAQSLKDILLNKMHCHLSFITIAMP